MQIINVFCEQSCLLSKGWFLTNGISCSYQVPVQNTSYSQYSVLRCYNTYHPSNCIFDTVCTVQVWKALVPHLSVQSLLDNIVRLASMGLFKPKSPEVEVICRRLQTPSDLSEAHVHPFSVLMAQRIYRSKKVEKTKAHWEINKELMKALTEAYYKAFEVRWCRGRDIKYSSNSQHSGQ